LIEEGDGSTTEYRFSDQRADVEVAEKRFDFQVPDGVEVVDGEIAP